MSRSVEILPENMRLLTEFRGQLRDCAEPAGREVRTREHLRQFFQRHAPSLSCQEYEGGSLAWFCHGQGSGPTLLLRCELDAVPLPSKAEGGMRATHSCGHDGHMAMMAGLGLELERNPPARGRVGLLFQAAEENGTGALALSKVERFRALRPDFLLALHNIPGWPLGQVVLRSGRMCCASRGLEITLAGQSSHAAHPDLGRSPAFAVARLIENLDYFNKASDTGQLVCMTTIVGASLGDRCFGTTPDQAALWATLRADSDQTMDYLAAASVDMVRSIAVEQNLEAAWSWHDVFPAVVNDAAACDLVRAAASRAGLSLSEPEVSFCWSEDFAYLASVGRTALVGLGSGESCSPLHGQGYGFPDPLIPFGVSLLRQMVAEAGL